MVGSAGIEPAAFTQEWRKAILYGFLQVTAPEFRHSPKGQANTCFLEPVVMPGLTTTPTFLVILTRAYLYIIERERKGVARSRSKGDSDFPESLQQNPFRGILLVSFSDLLSSCTKKVNWLINNTWRCGGSPSMSRNSASTFDQE